MHSLPASEVHLFVRTYFGSESQWQALCEVVGEGSDEGFVATVEFVDDPRFDSLSADALVAVHPRRDDGWDVMYVADERAVTEPARPVLVVRVGDPSDVPFRCRADLLYEVDANLTLANLDWTDFIDEIDESGVYGGLEAPAPSGDSDDPAVAAYLAASDRLVTIPVPPAQWFELHEDLDEVPRDIPGSKRATAIAETIVDQLDVVARMRPEDDVVVTATAGAWSFIR